MAKRQIKLSAFIPTTSQHAAGWRHPQSRPKDHLSIDYAIELAKLLNAACLMPISLQMVWQSTGVMVLPNIIRMWLCCTNI